MSTSFDLGDVEHFTVGTIGPRGQRVFYLQAGITGTVVSLKIEKQQVQALASFLTDALKSISDDPDMIQAEVDIGLIDPVETAWIVGDLGIGYDSATERMLIMATELAPDDADEDPATIRFGLTLNQVAGFVNRAQQVVAEGRPPCPYCGAPLNDDSAWCACSN